VACWPFSGAVGLVERFEDESQIHVVCNWTYLGSVSELSQAKLLDTMAAGFDVDGYKILCKPILNSAVELVLL
jgi:excinuclease Cho